MSDWKDKSPKKTKPNFLYAITSVSVVLFLLGLFGLILIHTRRLVKGFKEQIDLIVELREEVNDGQILDLKVYLEGQEYIKEGSVKFTSKEDGFELMKEELGEEFSKLDMPNPLYDIYTFNVQADFMQADSLEAIRKEIKSYEYVSDVFYQDTFISGIANNIRQMGFIILGLVLFFIAVAFTLIHNTIRLALYSNRFIIKNMELVGASWEFISKP